MIRTFKGEFIMKKWTVAGIVLAIASACAGWILIKSIGKIFLIAAAAIGIITLLFAFKRKRVDEQN